MNIGIITWHGGPNAGTFFQLYGLYSYLESRGHHVEVINYNNRPEDYISRGFAYYATQPLALIRRKMERRRERKMIVEAEARYADAVKLRAARFEEMYGKLKFTERVSTDEEFARLNDRFDAFIVGSDQTWNASMLNRRYFLDFAAKGKIKASYCPSMGTALVMRRQREVFRQYLQDFDYISAREGRLRDILQEELHREVYHLLDPSMLVSRDEYVKMAHLPEELKGERYLLCYFTPKNDAQVEQMRRFAKEKGLKVVIMAMSSFSLNIKDAFVYAAAGPREFVGLIANAAVVFTSSFHCTIFSVMLHRDLYVFEQRFTSKAADINQRYIEQLETYGISRRYIRFGKEITAENSAPIDYDGVETIFRKRVAESKAFLNKFC